MKRVALLGIVAILALIVSGCGPTAHIEKARNVDFGDYQTFAWAQRNERGLKAGIAEQRIKDAVSAELIRTQGWKEVKRSPDVILSYDVLVEKGTRVASEPMYSWGGFRTFYNPYARRFYRVYYPQRFVGYDNYNVPTREGTITITMVDAQSDETILQGWATDELNDRRITSREVDRIVNAIFKKWREEKG
ncbi:DUF4136 domain-containing protein [Niabella yanshanensis]|uniref:DUF4136 domain-containing protein n=1 Tax=Niabella yanshanensis TaxID=577386 RepID=A0ABZ0W9R2_9BACT|nr:DUF4136 domain-containing protein [Niabella yanshanensis]WQD39409.1 DUF4136 domain-containing protein [Niabella yanshanensis]